MAQVVGKGSWDPFFQSFDFGSNEFQDAMACQIDAADVHAERLGDTQHRHLAKDVEVENLVLVWVHRLSPARRRFLEQAPLPFLLPNRIQIQGGRIGAAEFRFGPSAVLSPRARRRLAPGSLAQKVRREGRVDSPSALRLLTEVAEAVITFAAAELASDTVLTVECWEVVITTGAQEAP